MGVVGSRQFAMLTLGMSLPLLFSFQLQAPPIFAGCAVHTHLDMGCGECDYGPRSHRGGNHRLRLSRSSPEPGPGEENAAAIPCYGLVFALVAEIVFMSARGHAA